MTLLLAEWENPTRLWERQPEAMADAWAEIDSVLADACDAHRGVRSETSPGDGFALAFARPRDGLACAAHLRETFAGRRWPGRLDLRCGMALHAGELEVLGDGSWAGTALARCARLGDLARSDQVLLSSAFYGLVADGLPADVGIAEHGVVGLRGLERPERVFELLREGDDARSLREVDRGLQLPPESTPLIGRQSEFAALRRTIEGSSMVSLVGTGGSGKTRLALRLAREYAERHASNVYWVDLAVLRDPERIASAVSRATGSGELGADDPIGDLTRWLARTRALLVLDNCEHLIEASSQLAAALLRSCPGLRLLATSREPLGIEGEVLFSVAPLPVPHETDDPDEAMRFDSVLLFVEQARRLQSDFRLTKSNTRAVAEICRRLDGLPLALELAAARIRTMSAGEILVALSDRLEVLARGPRSVSSRHRTLETSIDWSVRLLDPEERSLLGRLAVFPGSFDTAAVRAVGSSPDAGDDETGDVLRRLVERCLVEIDTHGSEARFRLLETIHHYVRERLADRSEMAGLRDRHLQHYAHFLVGLRAELEGGDPRSALARIGSELPNVRAALDWAIESGRAEDAIAMIEASQGYWAMRSLQPEMYQRTESALGSEDLDDAARARGCIMAARFAGRVGRFGVAVRFGRPGMELARRSGDRELLCDALIGWAYPSYQNGSAKAEESVAALDEAIELAEQLGDVTRLWEALGYRGIVRAAAIRRSDGMQDLEKAHALATEIGAPPLIALSHVFLATLDRLALRLEASREHVALAIRHAEGLIAGAPIAMAHTLLAGVEMLEGDLDAAAASLERAEEASHVAGHRIGAEVWSDSEVEVAEIAYRRGDLSGASVSIGLAVDGFREREFATHLHLSLHLVGLLAIDAGQMAKARATLDPVADFARRVTFPGLLGNAELGLAYLARRQGELEESWKRAHVALDAFSSSDYPAHTAIALELLGGLAAGRKRGEQGARLLGAADRVLSDRAGARRPIEAQERAWALEAARTSLGSEAFEEAFAEGRELSLEAAVDLARRGFGSRTRPALGWDSLTPAEREVARLVGRGMRNKAIAEELFVSLATVKTHLSHAYQKLGISSRAELAAEVARRPEPD